MDWNDFFERTRVAAKVESYSKLAPLLGITDGAIGHYRMGRRVPQVWVVADALRIQGHPEPEKQAIEIMKRAALTSPERTFWKRLAATAMALCLAVGFALPHKAQAAVTGFDNGHVVYIMRKSGFCDFIGGPPPVRHCVSQRLQPLAVLAPTGKQKAGQRWRHHRHPDPHLARVQPRQQRRIHAPYPRGFPPPPVHRQATIPEPESCGR